MRRAQSPAPAIDRNIIDRIAEAASMLCRGVELLNEVVAEVSGAEVSGEGDHGDEKRGPAGAPD